MEAVLLLTEQRIILAGGGPKHGLEWAWEIMLFLATSGKLLIHDLWFGSAMYNCIWQLLCYGWEVRSCGRLDLGGAQGATAGLDYDSGVLPVAYGPSGLQAWSMVKQQKDLNKCW